jgi:hypothetical protein
MLPLSEPGVRVAALPAQVEILARVAAVLVVPECELPGPPAAESRVGRERLVRAPRVGRERRCTAAGQ